MLEFLKNIFSGKPEILEASVEDSSEETRSEHEDGVPVVFYDGSDAK